MGDIPRAAAVRGKTIHYIWLEGPTKGKTYEHVFHPDGTVEFHETGSESQSGAAKHKAAEGKGQPEQSSYTAMEAARDAYLVSYLSKTGYTLTVVLDFKSKQMVGIASGGTTWVPVTGRFEVVSS